MKGKSRLYIIATGLFLIICGISVFVYSVPIKESSFLLREDLTARTIAMLPVTTDFRNYFVLQSVNNKTTVLIGDFSGADKVISASTDTNLDGDAENITEYYPDSRKNTNPTKSSSQFFSDFKKLKEDIINGTIYNANYSYKMMSLNTLHARIKAGKDIYEWKYGYNVKVYDPDSPSTIMGEFFFSRKDGLYTMIFATYYYKLYKTKITPPIYYSVYCRDTKDPKVIEVVNALYKMLPPK